VKSRINSKPESLPTGKSWYEEFGLIARFPRPPLERMFRLMRDIQEPQIFMHPSGNDKTDIIIRLPVSSAIVPIEMKDQFERFGVTLQKAFEDVLWLKLEGEGSSSTWGRLADLGAKVFRQTLLQWFRLQYLGHFHPAADATFKKLKDEMELATKVTRRGRRPAIRAELASIRKRYDELLPQCTLVHQAAEHAATLHNDNNVEVARKMKRRAIWETVHGQIHGMPSDGYIFDNVAFRRIPRGTAKLHEPSSWKPHQLAISMLTFERNQAYQTIEKKITPTKRKS